MTESHINWRVGPDDAEWNPIRQSRLDQAASEARQHFEEVSGRSWSSARGDDPPAVWDAGSEAFDALIESARYRRRRNDPISQWIAASTEKRALIWRIYSDIHLEEHGVKWADYWTDRILEFFEPFGDKQTSGRDIALDALRLIIRHCAVCPSCDAITYHWDPPRGREAKCEDCKRWDRRLKPYSDLRTEADFARLLQRQGGKCALCTESDPPVPEGALDGWHIDHDHATGKVRGILCPSCNAKVGKHEADRDARGAIEDYLNR